MFIIVLFSQKPSPGSLWGWGWTLVLSSLLYAGPLHHSVESSRRNLFGRVSANRDKVVEVRMLVMLMLTASGFRPTVLLKELIKLAKFHFC